MSLITSLFCPLCQEPYDDTNKRPRLGSCRHNVCDLCIATRVQCPICNEKNAFSEVLYNFELCKMLEAFNENVTEENFQRISNNTKSLDLGACTSCLTTERLRVCVTCAETSHIFKQLPNGKFQVLNHNRALQLTKFVYFCSDCIADGQPDHAEHQFLPPSKIDAMKIDLNYWQYIIHAKLLEKKMYDEENKEVQDKTQLFNRILLEFRRQALSYEVAMKSSQFEKLEDQFKLTRIKQVDILSIPELADAKRRSFEKAQMVISRLLKLQERILWHQRDKIKLEIRNMSYHESKDPVVLKFREELSNLSLRFDSFRITELSQPEAEQLDRNANSKLEEAMQKLPFYKLDKKFRVYKALCSILKDSDEKRKRVTEMMMKEWTNETKKRPRLGSCSHSVCHPCIGTRVQCPICMQENSFKEVSYTFELCKMLETFKEKVTEENFERISDNPKKLDLGVCKSCLTTERLRMCMTCAENSKLFKKLSNGKYQITMMNKPFFIAKSVYFCSDCIADGQPDHPQHLFLPLSKIETREMDLEYWYYIIHALFLSKKIDEEVHRPIHEEAQIFKRILFQFKRQALSYEVMKRSDPFHNTEDFIKLRFMKYVDIMSLPELARAKEKSLEVAQKVINRYWKLQERQLWCNKHEINMMVERQDNSEDPIFVKFKEDISDLATKFNNLLITELSQSEADQIDELSDAKLEEAMRQLNLPDLGPDKKKLYVYKAICNLLQNAVDRKEKATGKLKKEVDSFLEFFNNRLKQIEKEMKKDPLAQRLFLFEITERSLKMDKLKIEQLEAMCDHREGELIWERWFPDTNNGLSEDAYYHFLLSQKFMNDSCSVTDKLFSQASNTL
ncbi:hypothetical protein CAEBREN_25508 [Caenorhabditis brenneri]|uniref:RING-type domain-containing protein n=1 Tax=Caenorhabditis brenneri TaxID=135651 RepID=G0NSG2_CAEBE|nr:hypothetical protein CAEBREN_25508 [Caenorhabditis brenneri]